VASVDTGIRIIPVDEVPWDDVQTVFGTKGDPSTCWCQWFKLSASDWRTVEASACQAALREQTLHRPVPGLIAYLDDEAVGWVAVEPRPAHPRLRTSRIVAKGSTESHDDASVWAVTCFVVRVGFRRRGIASALVTAAVEHARTNGARVLEGYPIDTAEKKASSAELYHGALSLFVAAGFEIASRPQPGRAVVRLRF
jgi:GNAT superfamily N-acetyltransferase